jgi:1-acyl-sn-glycerol-3-phosphate acyltransferase
MQWLPRTVWRSLAGLDVIGRENVPGRGPFLLIANHESNLDPVLIQAVCPRIVHAMAKSTQFSAPIVGSLMRRLYAFPVRRYQVDPQAVRVVLRRLAAGAGVCIYIEGERTWDGRIQPPRPGTLRIALHAGVPIVPCAISGAYAAWPRWAGRPQWSRVRIAFGEPLRLPVVRDRASREAALPEAEERVMGAISSLRVSE